MGSSERMSTMFSDNCGCHAIPKLIEFLGQNLAILIIFLGSSTGLFPTFGINKNRNQYKIVPSTIVSQAETINKLLQVFEQSKTTINNRDAFARAGIVPSTEKESLTAMVDENVLFHSPTVQEVLSHNQTHSQFGLPFAKKCGIINLKELQNEIDKRNIEEVRLINMH